jgi:hypothetical protein
MSPLAVTSITDFALGAEALILGGLMARWPKARFSAAWFWCAVMLLAGAGAIMGGIDHGIVEPAGLPRFWIQRPNWIVLGAMTFCVLMTTARQFFAPRWQRIILTIGLVQFVASAAAMLRIDDFRVVVVNYAPAMLLLLAMNIAGLRKANGSWEMIVGIVISFAAAGIQAAGVDALSPLDHNGLYHVGSMIGMAFLYAGGKKLRVK